MSLMIIPARSEKPSRLTSLLILATGLLLPVLGCTVGEGNPVQQNLVSKESIPIIWQAAGDYSPLARANRLLIRSQADLAQLRFPTLPDRFDPETQMLLIATMNQQPTGGYHIRIARVYRQGSKIHVDLRRYFPDPQKSPSTGPTRPFHVVAIPRSDLNVVGFSTNPNAFQTVPFNPYQ